MIESIFWVIVVFAVIVLVHEGGHFLFARLYNIEVEEFCIGFGPKLWGFRRGETYYGICLFPLGGYVKVAGMDPDEPRTERSFNTQPVWRRFWVIVAGPLFNFILAVLLVFALGFFGFPRNMIWIGTVLPDGPADRAGIKPFDVIAAVNGRELDSVRPFHEAIRSSEGKALRLTIERQGELTELDATPAVIEGFNEGNPSLGITLDLFPLLKRSVSGVIPNSPAMKAGLRVDDEVISVNGESAHDGLGVLELVNRLGRTAETPPEDDPSSILVPVTVKYLRDSVEREVTLTPEFDERFGENVAYVGIAFKPVLVKLPFGEALATTFEYLRDMMSGIYFGLRSFVKAPGKSLIGPVGITNMIAQSARDPYQLLIIAILLNINLGLINLFPIPALDGGRLVFILLEGVFRIKVSAHKEALAHLFGFVMLIGLILFITFKEVYGLIQ